MRRLVKSINEGFTEGVIIDGMYFPDAEIGATCITIKGCSTLLHETLLKDPSRSYNVLMPRDMVNLYDDMTYTTETINVDAVYALMSVTECFNDDVIVSLRRVGSL